MVQSRDDRRCVGIPPQDGRRLETRNKTGVDIVIDKNSGIIVCLSEEFLEVI